MFKIFFKSIRLIDQPQPTKKQGILHVLSFFIFGVLLGILAKFSDTVSTNGGIGMIIGFISDITTHLGLWVFLATVIAVWSRSPLYAGINVGAFFIGMLLAYYIYSLVLFGFFPTYYFLRWGMIAIVAPFAASLVWFSNGKGWMAAFFAALPIGLLLSQGYSFFYFFSIVSGLDLILAIILLIILSKSKVQYSMVVPLSVLVFLFIRNSDVLLYIFGGL